MLELLIALSALEAIVVLAVLALYLLLIWRSLHASARYFAKISFGVRAIETQAGAVGPAVGRINGALERIAPALPGLVERAERLASMRRA